MSGKRVVVIGAGLGGLSAAISLAADGFEVEVFEKNEHACGKLNQLRKEGFSFDLGPSLLTFPHYFESLFSRHGRRMRDYLAVRPLSPHWRNFFEDGVRIDLYPDPAETVARNATLTEQDEGDLRRFLAYSKALYEKVSPGYFDRGLDTLWELVRFHGVVSTLRDFDLFATMDDGVRRHVRSPHLRAILDFFVKYVGSSAFDAPALLNLMPYGQFEFGLLYTDGGMYQLALALRRLAEEVGVRLNLGVEVMSLDRAKGRITAAILADGRRAEADWFVCNMEVIPAYRKLLGESEDFLRKFRKFEPACSGLVLHLGTNREYPQLAHHNFFFSRDPEKHFDSVFHKKILPEDPTLYVAAPARTDRTQAPEGCENIKVLPHVPHLQEKRFAPEEYAALRNRVLDKLERMGLENLRKHVIVEDMWTPEDIERRYYSNRGAIYGVVADRKKNLGIKAPKKSVLYPNLYFVGGSVNPGGGMPMVVLSGQQVRDRIVGEVQSGQTRR